MSQERSVSILEQRNVSYRKCAQGLAVVAVCQADKAGLRRTAAVMPEMEAHFQCNLDRRRPITAVKAVTELAVGQSVQSLRQLHHRFVSEAGKNNVLELVELRHQRRIDT